MNRKESKARYIGIAICILIFLGLQVLNIKYSSDPRFTPFNGVIMAGQFLACLSMAFFDRKKGMFLAKIMVGLIMINIVMVILRAHILSPLPGLCNSVIYMGLLFILDFQFRKRENQAVTDSLTGLLNRRGLFEALRKRERMQKSFGLAYIEIGNFKFIRDNYGHAYAEKLLTEVASRIVNSLSKEVEIARISGEEFVVVFPEKNNIDARVEKVLKNLCEKYIIQANDIESDCYLKVYAGIAYYPDNASNSHDLLKYADIAMYQASKEKKSCVKVYDKNEEEKMWHQLQIEKQIKVALQNDNFFLVYQPQYSIKGKYLRGFETLIRMKDENGNLVSPAEFIPIAEKDVLILQIDEYVLRRAMTEFRTVAWDKKKDLVLSVNISARNIGEHDFVDRLLKIIREVDFPIKNLEIEITEYCMVDSMEVSIGNIKRLRELGVKIAIDDFGTGYTSLNYLAKMPVNLLKIDKSLIDGIESDEKTRNFVKTVISLGHLMDCEVISEGVESENQVKVLKDEDCDFIQGYVWSMPLCYEDALEEVRKYY